MKLNRRQFGCGAVALAAAPAVLAQPASRDIIIGQVASLSGTNGADLGLGLKQGIEAALATAGADARRVRLVSMDDRYMPEETVRLTRELVETHKPVALIGYRGTANTLALVRSRVLEEAGVPLVGTLTGAAEVQGAPWVYHLRTSYPEEISRLVRQLARLGMTQLGLLYVDDAFGRSGREAVQRSAREAGASIAVEAAYDKASDKVEADISAAAKRLAAAAPQAVVMVAVGDPVYQFVRQAKQRAPSLRLFSISVVNPSAVIESVGLDAARGMGFSQVFPFPFSDGSPLVRDYRAALRRIAPEAAPGYFSLEGYIYARVLIEALRRTGRQPAPEQVRQALDALPPLDLGGFFVRFDPATRNGSSFTDLTVVAAGGRLLR